MPMYGIASLSEQAAAAISWNPREHDMLPSLNTVQYMQSLTWHASYTLHHNCRSGISVYDE